MLHSKQRTKLETENSGSMFFPTKRPRGAPQITIALIQGSVSDILQTYIPVLLQNVL